MTFAPPPPHLSSFSKQVWVVSPLILPKFSVPPPPYWVLFGDSPFCSPKNQVIPPKSSPSPTPLPPHTHTHTHPKATNNDQSLINLVLDTLSHQPTHASSTSPFTQKRSNFSRKFPLLHLSPDLFLFFLVQAYEWPKTPRSSVFISSHGLCTVWL